MSPSASPLATSGTGFYPLDPIGIEPAIDPAILASVSAAGVAKAETIPVSGDNVGVLVVSGLAALSFSALVLFSTLRLRFNGAHASRAGLRQVTGA